MAQRSTVIFGDQIDITAAGRGLTKDANDDFEVLLDDVTLEHVNITGIGDTIQIKDDGVTTSKILDENVTEPKLDILNAPADGYVLAWNNTSMRMEWVDVDVNSVQESDLIYNEVPAGAVDSVNTTYTLAGTPTADSKVRVYLNGSRQRQGGGFDYTISGSTITFAKAPRTGSDILADYLIA